MDWGSFPTLIRIGSHSAYGLGRHYAFLHVVSGQKMFVSPPLVLGTGKVALLSSSSYTGGAAAGHLDPRHIWGQVVVCRELSQ